MSARFDVAIIGAGIVGVSTALHLLERGKTVCLIDKRGVGTETSSGNAGVIQNYHALPFGAPSLGRVFGILRDRDTAARIDLKSLPAALPWIIRFYLQSRHAQRRRNGCFLRPLHVGSLDEHRALMRGTDAVKYLSEQGRMAVYRTEASFAAARWELDVAREAGAAFQVLGPLEMRELEPFLQPVFWKAVAWTASARLTNPQAVTEAYAERFVREGGVLMDHAVQDVRQAADETWTLKLPSVSVLATEVVVATGPWANDTLKPLGIRFPLLMKRGYHKHYRMEGRATFHHSITDTDFGYVMAPMEQGHRLVTGAEFAARDAPPNPRQLENILPFARQLFPLGEAVNEGVWCGSRPCFADSRPVIGPAARHKGLWFNLGHGHWGMTTGPSAGRLIAEMMTGSPVFCDPAPYSAARFNC